MVPANLTDHAVASDYSCLIFCHSRSQPCCSILQPYINVPHKMATLSVTHRHQVHCPIHERNKYSYRFICYSTESCIYRSSPLYFQNLTNELTMYKKSYLINRYDDSGQGNAKNRASNLVKFGVPTPGDEW